MILFFFSPPSAWQPWMTPVNNVAKGKSSVRRRRMLPCFFFGVCVCACAKCMPAKFIYSVPWFFSLFRRFCLTTVLDFQQSNMWHPGGKKILFSTSSLTKTTTFGFATSTTCDILLNSTPAQPTLSLNSESNIKSFMHELTLKWHTAVQEELSSQESNYPWTLCSLGTLC